MRNLGHLRELGAALTYGALSQFWERGFDTSVFPFYLVVRVARRAPD